MDISDEEAAFHVDAQPEASGSGSPPSESGNAPKVGKKALKRAARLARAEELRPLKRQAEKIRRRERAVQLKEGLAAGTLSQAERELVEGRRAREKEKKAARKTLERDLRLGSRPEDGVEGPGGNRVWGGGVVVDLGFDELMTDNEISSMASQLSYVYSANRLAPRPFAAILHTSASSEASPRLWERMVKSNCERWGSCHWEPQGIEAVSREFGSEREETRMAASGDGSGSTDRERREERGAPMTAPTTDIASRLPEAEPSRRSSIGAGAGPTFEASSSPQIIATPSSSTRPTIPPPLSPSAHTLIYLSADSPHELTTLSPTDIYVIGGIVDRNRYKNLCQEKAERLGIRTARLPIGTYLEKLETRKVLTVNQVFSILVEYVARQDWKAAFEAVVPLRKFHTVSRHAKRKKAKTALDGEEEGGEADEEELLHEGDEGELLHEGDEDENPMQTEIQPEQRKGDLPGIGEDGRSAMAAHGLKDSAVEMLGRELRDDRALDEEHDEDEEQAMNA